MKHFFYILFYVISITAGAQDTLNLGGVYFYNPTLNGRALSSPSYLDNPAFTANSTNTTASLHQAFALIGQSNIQGRDGDLTNPDYPFPSQIGAVYFNGTDTVTLTTLRGGASLGCMDNYFADLYYQLTGYKMVSIEAAEGGAGLGENALLAPGTNHWGEGGARRTEAVTLIDSALSYFNLTAPYAALWIQGERDAQQIDADVGYTKDSALVNMRNVIEWWQSTYPGVPFLIAELGNDSSGSTAGFNQIREVQRQVCVEYENVYMAFTGAKYFTEQGKQRDALHYNYKGYRDVGEAFARFIASPRSFSASQTGYYYYGHPDSLGAYRMLAQNERFYVELKTDTGWTDVLTPHYTDANAIAALTNDFNTNGIQTTSSPTFTLRSTSNDVIKFASLNGDGRIKVVNLNDSTNASIGTSAGGIDFTAPWSNIYNGEIAIIKGTYTGTGNSREGNLSFITFDGGVSAVHSVLTQEGYTVMSTSDLVNYTNGVNTLPTARTLQVLAGGMYIVGQSIVADNIQFDAVIGAGTNDFETWHPDYTVIQIGKTSSLFAEKNVSTSQLQLLNNAYLDTLLGWKYRTLGAASAIRQYTGGTISFRTAPSGAANSAITWTDRLWISNTGNIGINTNNPETELDVAGDIKTGAANWHYWGPTDTDGSFRLGFVSGDFVLQERQTGSWVTVETVYNAP